MYGATVTEPLELPPVVPDPLVPGPLELPPVVPDPLVPEPLELPPVVSDPLVPESLELPPVVPDPLVPEPLELPPVVPDPLVLDPLVLDPLEPPLVVPEPLVPEPLELPPVVPPSPAAFKATVAAAVRTANSCRAFSSAFEALLARATACLAAAAVDRTNCFVVGEFGCNFATAAAASACDTAVRADVAAALAAFQRVCANCCAWTALFAEATNAAEDVPRSGLAAVAIVGTPHADTTTSNIINPNFPGRQLVNRRDLELPVKRGN